MLIPFSNKERVNITRPGHHMARLVFRLLSLAHTSYRRIVGRTWAHLHWLDGQHKDALTRFTGAFVFHGVERQDGRNCTALIKGGSLINMFY